MTTLKERRRYDVLADVRHEDVFWIFDEVFGAYCGLDGEPLAFPTYASASGWLVLCEEAGLPLRYAVPSGTGIPTAMVSMSAVHVPVGHFLWDADRGQWVRVVHRSADQTHVFLFLEGRYDSIKIARGEQVRTCSPLAFA